jgi:hypothetical protein
MANINEAFPSKYLKASDLDGKPALFKIDRADFESIGADKRLILYFENQNKGMVLNKTNANSIAKLYGDDTDDWCGQEIVLFEAMVDFKGETVSAIRVRAPKKPPVKKPAADMNDEVPF